MSRSFRAAPGVSPTGNSRSEALFLRTFSDRITLVAQEAIDLDADYRAALAKAGIAVAPSPLARMEFSSDQVSLYLTDDSELDFDTIYPALGSDSNNELARQLGVQLGDDRCIVIDAKQRTSVAGVYAPAISSCRSIRSVSPWATRR